MLVEQVGDVQRHIPLVARRGLVLVADPGIQWDVSLNVTNLLDEEYVSTIGTNGFTSGNAFFNQSLMVGAPRQVFVTVRKTF